MMSRAAEVFSRLQKEANQYAAQSAGRTDGEAEESRESAVSVEYARQFWGIRGYDALPPEGLARVARGLDPRENVETPLVNSAYWREGRWLSTVAAELCTEARK